MAGGRNQRLADMLRDKDTRGGFEVYRATKAALNQMFRSYAARHAGERRALLLMAPGWVRTGLGGPGAMLEIGDLSPEDRSAIERQVSGANHARSMQDILTDASAMLSGLSRGAGGCRIAI